MASRKLPIVLGLTQTTVTALITFWADRMEWLRGDSRRIPPHFIKLHLAVVDLREVWRAINGPTYPFNFAGQKLGFHLLSFSWAELLYLGAVAIFWYLVGCLYYQRKTNTGRLVTFYALIWGTIMVLLSFLFVHRAYWLRLDYRLFDPLIFLTALIYAVWSFILFRFGVGNLRNRF